MPKLYILGLITLATFIIGLAFAEQFTLSTYYPAPFGVYNQMVTRCLGVGDQNNDGLIDYKDTPEPTTNPNQLWVVGKVGIGTTEPQAKLHIAGTAGIDGIMFPDNTLQTTRGVVSISVQVFDTAGTYTYTPPPGLLFAIVEVQGAGGGGGGGETGPYGPCTGEKGGGGGAGGYARKILSAADIGESQTIIVGAGGAGSSCTTGIDGQAGNGGTSSFGSLLSATGGKGGFGDTGGTAQDQAGGQGGVGIGGDINLTGNCGIAAGGGNAWLGGNGGGSYFGGGGGGAYAAGGKHGGGGCGGGFYGGGGNGGDGLVIVTEFKSQ